MQIHQQVFNLTLNHLFIEWKMKTNAINPGGATSGDASSKEI